ncbi:hypothetical protein PV350_41210 [Streptomyces sp. PA03-6a]|nr:hypothetical protein [Streptomyces sp. PA03-6a]
MENVPGGMSSPDLDLWLSYAREVCGEINALDYRNVSESTLIRLVAVSGVTIDHLIRRIEAMRGDAR